MLRIAGVCLVFAGIAGALFAWMEANRIKIMMMEKVVLFIAHAAYRLETEKLSAGALFLALSGEEKSLSGVLLMMCRQMESHTYPSAEKLWCTVWAPYMEAWHFPDEFAQLVRTSARGFFGVHLKENLALLETVQAHMNVLIGKEKQEFAEKRQVFTPVCVLGGIMAVIILW